MIGPKLLLAMAAMAVLGSIAGQVIFFLHAHPDVLERILK